MFFTWDFWRTLQAAFWLVGFSFFLSLFFLSFSDFMGSQTLNCAAAAPGWSYGCLAFPHYCNNKQKGDLCIGALPIRVQAEFPCPFLCFHISHGMQFLTGPSHGTFSNISEEISSLPFLFPGRESAMGNGRCTEFKKKTDLGPTPLL